MAAPNDQETTPETAAEWPKTFTWKRIPISIPNPEDWPLKVTRAFEVGHVIDALAGLLGDATWARIENMTARQCSDLFEKITALVGFEDLGE
jgi:hypothetical protein